MASDTPYTPVDGGAPKELSAEEIAAREAQYQRENPAAGDAAVPSQLDPQPVDIDHETLVALVQQTRMEVENLRRKLNVVCSTFNLTL